MTDTEVKRARLSKPFDKRALRSRDALRGALLRLLETQSIEKIAIKDITKEAGVSYPVFFRQFSAREDLLADVAKVEVRNLLERTYPNLDIDNPQANLPLLCNYIAEHRALWKTLLTTDAVASMRVEFARFAADAGDSARRANPWLPVELASSLVAGAMLEVLAWWLNQRADYPIKNVCALLDALVVTPTLVPRHIQLD